MIPSHLYAGQAYRPGSELFLVLNEQRDTLSPRFPDLMNRSFIVKINRLVRF